MQYGLYLSAGGVLTNLHRQDVLANNLANLETTGFKPDMVFGRQRLPERIENPGGGADPQRLLEQLGGGRLAHPTRMSARQGSLQATGNPLDIAVVGEGYLVATTDGSANLESLRLTRDGRLTINGNNDLVMASTGMHVVNQQNRPIRIPGTGPVQIDGNGVVRQDGNEVDRIQVANTDPESLLKAGQNLFRIDTASGATLQPATGQLRQSFTEASATDPILTLNAMIGATKAAQANAKLMQYHDFIAGQAIGTFGRVA